MQLSQEEIKKLVGQYAARFVQNGMKLGLGTGSTIFYLIQELALRHKQGLDFSIVPTSKATESLAMQQELPVIPIDRLYDLDLTIDGADEIDPAGNLIKGGGGALLQEKIVASASRQLIIIADDLKKVNQLGRFPLPVEVMPFAFAPVISKIKSALNIKRVELRSFHDKPFVTDHQHYILDCYFENIPDLLVLNDQLHRIPGVVETGLFIKMANRVIIGYPDGRIESFDYR